MTKVVVTGGSGRAGQFVIRDLVAHGYEVLNVDLEHPEERLCSFCRADLTDTGQVYAVLKGADVVVHLGAIPISGRVPEPVLFSTNLLSTYNVFHAATSLDVRRVVWASSVQVYGVPFADDGPVYLPIDEDHPTRARTDYPMTKILGEDMARLLHQRTGVPFAGLRLAWIVTLPETAGLPYWQQEELQADHLWGYVDGRDVALAIRLALTVDLPGAEVFNIAAADTSARNVTRALCATYYPGVPLRQRLDEHQTLFSIEKARRMLGYEPQHTWRGE